MKWERVNNMTKNAIILAAGKGTRMNMDIPKAAVEVSGKPMINRVVDSCLEAGIENIVVVVGHQREIVEAMLVNKISSLKDNQKISFAYQNQQLGTAHACMSAYENLQLIEGDTMILPVDMPLIGAYNIIKLMDNHQQNHNAMTILSTIIDDPFSYGRIIRNESDNIDAIIEENEASFEQKLINEINTGAYVVDNKLLFDSLKQVDNNNHKKEYYLTDIVKILTKEHKVNALCVEFSYRLIGINDVETLKKVEELMEKDKQLQQNTNSFNSDNH